MKSTFDMNFFVHAEEEECFSFSLFLFFFFFLPVRSGAFVIILKVISLHFILEEYKSTQQETFNSIPIQ